LFVSCEIQSRVLRLSSARPAVEPYQFRLTGKAGETLSQPRMNLLEEFETRIAAAMGTLLLDRGVPVTELLAGKGVLSFDASLS